MTRNLILAAAAWLALGFTQATPKAAAADDFYEILAKLQAGRNKYINSLPSINEKLYAGQQKYWDNYYATADKRRAAQAAAAFYSRVTVPYYSSFYYGPYYVYTPSYTPRVYVSPGSNSTGTGFGTPPPLAK